MTRKPRFAGSFYAGNKDKLIGQIRNSFLSDIGPKTLPPSNAARGNSLKAVIVPHAGYAYSGPIAAWAYLEASKKPQPGTIILIGPNHTGAGSEIAISKADWETPLGIIKTDSLLSEKIGADFELDDLGHAYEHSLEVQLPFLQFIFGNKFKVVCISMLGQSREKSLNLAKKISSVFAEDSLIVATTDLSHYKPQEIAKRHDKQLIKALMQANIENAYKLVSRDVSACGIGPSAVAVKTGELLGANKIELLKYETSAATTGDENSVVGYASLSISSLTPKIAS